MEQRFEAGLYVFFQGGDPGHNVLDGFRGLVLIEIPGHGDLIADLGFLRINPGVGGIRKDFPFEIFLNIFLHGDVLGIPQVGVRNGLAFLQDGIAVLILLRALDGDLPIAEFLGIKDLALAVNAVLFPINGIVFEFPIGLHDQGAAFVGDIVPLGADAFAPGLEAVAGVDELDLTGAAGGLILGADPDIGRNAGVHELISAELDDGVQPVVFEDIAADLAGAALRVAGEEGRTVLDNRHFPVGGQLGQAVQDEELLAVGDLRETGGKAAELAPGVFLLDGFLLPLPVDAEGRVRNAVLEGIAGELIVGEGIAETHIVRIPAADHHIGLGDGEGAGVELLAEAGDLDVAVQVVDALLHTGEHLAGAHGHIVDGDVAGMGQIRVGEQEIGHEINDIPAGEMGPGFLAEGLGEAAH